MTGASPWKWFSRPSAAHVAVSETSSSSRGLRSVLAFYFARRQDGGMCVGVCIVRWGTRRKWQKQRRSLCLPPVLSPYSSTPPSMCCLWIKLIKAPQIRSPEEGGGRERERFCGHISTHTHTQAFFHECRIQAEGRDTVHAEMCSQPPLWTTFSPAL